MTEYDCYRADVAGLAGYDTFGANASGIDWLGNAEKAHYMMSRYWANSTSETDCLCGGGYVSFSFCSRSTEVDGLQSKVAARRKSDLRRVLDLFPARRPRVVLSQLYHQWPILSRQRPSVRKNK
jgi:hypothetical protein